MRTKPHLADRWPRASRLRAPAVPLLLVAAALLLVGCERGESDLFTDLLERWGVLGGCLGAYLGGLFVSLTPCVYPMIALTVSLFGASAATTRKRAIFLSAMYVLGLCAMYTPLGVAAGLGGGLFGAALSSPWVMGPVVVILTALALALMGYWELALPSSIQTRLSRVGGAGPVGAFLMGLVAGLLAAPCAGPVTLALIAWVGTTGNPLLGGLYFFCFALGIGTLFFAVGAFAMSLPRAGKWTDLLKSLGGLAILLLAGYYLRLLVPPMLELEWRTPWLLGGAVVLVVAGAALGAVHLSVAGAPVGAKVRKAVAVLLFAVGGTALVLAATEGEEPIEWRTDYAEAYDEARELSRPVLMDFTAAWCGACGELDRETFSDRRVADEAELFVPIRVDATRNDAASEAFMARFEVRGLPTVLVIDESGEVRARITEFVPPERMLEALRAAR